MSKIIASFDIGIRNLAYCKMEYFPDNISGNKFKIHDWNVIDLFSDGKCEKLTKPEKCLVVIKSGQKIGEKCGNMSHFSYKCDNNDKKLPMYVCKTHSKSFDQSSLTRSYSMKNITLHELAKLAIKKLDEIDFSDTSEVIFESQPNKNPIMKNFSMMLFNYFIIRYIVEKDGTLKDTKFISSHNKLSIYDGPYVECKLKNQYTRNKFYGKIYCRYIIRNSDRVDFFDKFKKRDDLADSFLQGAWYLMSSHKPCKNTEIPPNKDLKIKLKLKSDSHSVSETETAKTAKTPVIQEPSLKPKIKLKITTSVPLLPTHGKTYLKNVKHNNVNKMIKYDYNFNRFKNLKKGVKPHNDIKTRLTLTNIKYIIDKNIQDIRLEKTLKFYFGQNSDKISNKEYLSIN